MLIADVPTVTGIEKIWLKIWKVLCIKLTTKSKMQTEIRWRGKGNRMRVMLGESSYISRKDCVRWGASGQINWRRRPLGQATLPERFGKGLQCLPEIRCADIQSPLFRNSKQAQVGESLWKSVPRDRAYILELPERDKLHNVPHGGLARGRT